jgi:hypothetical protein
MGLVREPLNVDFEFDPRPLTETDKKAISDFIKADKLKNRKAKKSEPAKGKRTRLSKTRSKTRVK